MAPELAPPWENIFCASDAKAGVVNALDKIQTNALREIFICQPHYHYFYNSNFAQCGQSQFGEYASVLERQVPCC
jgi:hypothetical protein